MEKTNKKIRAIKIESYLGGYDSNSFYILSSGKDAAVIDCFDAKIVLDYLKEHNLKLKYIISTHNHFDHVEANKDLLSHTKAKLVMHKSNDCDIKVDEGTELELGDLSKHEDSKEKSTLKILYTPGHTMDSICILADDKFLFTGDTLFVKTIGGIFCHNGEKYQKESIKRLMKLNDDIIIYPGHNYGGQSATIKEIKQNNNKVKEILKE
jgi:hydroxyacylglutathione hydrolase